MKVNVTKRNGQVEPFDPQKILRVVLAAGLDPDKAQQLTTQVTKTIAAQKTSSITSLQIRDLVIGELHHLDEAVAKFFTWYQKTKEIKPR